MSVTYQPKATKRKRKHGFLVRQETTSGQNIIRNRRRKGRASLAV
jgi:large subunit ribosomal protein L34